MIERIPELPTIIVLRLRNMTAIDATGMQALENLSDAVHHSGRGLILCGAREQPARLMHQAEFEDHVGAGNISPRIAVALERAKVLYQEIEQRNLHALSESAKSQSIKPWRFAARSSSSQGPPDDGAIHCCAKV